MIVSAATFPTLHAAFRLVEADNGGHLIGTVYPGERIDLDRFDVPIAWEKLVPFAEDGLARLRAGGEEDFETFVAGECSEQDAIARRQGDLGAAHTILNDWFNGWQDEDRPALDLSDPAQLDQAVPGMIAVEDLE